jgi:hypothetical protein
LIERAQRASDRITGVLRTAAKLSETHDELDAEYDSRMQQQVAILTVTFLVLLGVLLFLRVFFIPTIGDLVANNEEATQALANKLEMDNDNVRPHVARALEVDESRGMMKAVVDADTKKLLGAAVLGIEGGELMSVLQTAMMGELPVTELKNAPYAHPTLAESLNNLFAGIDE